MKIKHVFVLLSGLLVALPQLTAQEQQTPAPTTLVAQVQSSSKGKVHRMRIMAPPTVAKGAFVRVVSAGDPPVPDQAKNYKLFFIETPDDLASALRAYSNDELSTAKRQLGRVRATYAGFAGLPNNPATMAALMELSCNARAMDWAGLSAAAAEFPSPKLLEAPERAKVEAAAILGKVSDDPATAEARQKEAEQAIASAAKTPSTTSEVYTWLKYALGRALASNIPAAELQKGIGAEHEKVASLAVDAYCEAVASSHGRFMEIPVDAMHRAFQILWAMPGVKSYMSKAKKVKMGKKAWEEAPYNFRDAVALAYLLRNVYAPQLKDEAISTACSFYFNEQLGSKKAAK